MFGATHVLAIDGYSRKIVGFITLPKKKAVHVYDVLFRPLLLSKGLWEQVRVDHGSEFALVLTSQQLLSPYRRSTRHLPVLQSLSRQNHRAERIWPEINQRVNYPLKWILVEMENNGEISMGDNVTKFCVSWVVISVMESPIKDFISAWNSHRIPGRNGGIPNQLASHNGITPLSPSVVPSTAQCVQAHESSGRHLAHDLVFGSDPLMDYPQLQSLRENQFRTEFPDLDLIFKDILHRDGQLFKNCIHRLAHSYAQLIFVITSY